MRMPVTIAALFLLAAFSFSTALAVEPPSVSERQQVESAHQKEAKKRSKEWSRESRESGCPYGRDHATGKCYQPKEGQFYRDPQTGEVKRKGVKKWNLPWN